MEMIFHGETKLAPTLAALPLAVAEEDTDDR